MEELVLDNRPSEQDRFLHTRLTRSQPYPPTTPLHAHLHLEAPAAAATKENQHRQPPSLEREDIVTLRTAIQLLLIHQAQGIDLGPESGLKTGTFVDDAGKAVRSSVVEDVTRRLKSLDEKGAAEAQKVLDLQRSAVQRLPMPIRIAPVDAPTEIEKTHLPKHREDDPDRSLEGGRIHLVSAV